MPLNKTSKGWSTQNIIDIILEWTHHTAMINVIHFPSIICAVVGPGVGAWKCETVGDTDDGVPGVLDITSAFFISLNCLWSLEFLSLEHCIIWVYNTNIWDMILNQKRLDGWWDDFSSRDRGGRLLKKWKYIRKMANAIELPETRGP